MGEGEAASSRVIIVERHCFDMSMKLSKSYPNRRNENWNCNTPKYTLVVFNMFRVFVRYKMNF